MKTLHHLKAIRGRMQLSDSSGIKFSNEPDTRLGVGFSFLSKEKITRLHQEHVVWHIQAEGAAYTISNNN